MKGEGSNGKSSKLLIGILVAVIVACLAGAGVLARYVISAQQSIQEIHKQAAGTDVPATPEEAVEEDGSMENPIDFAALQKQNPDIYAWIYIPGTEVNYPVVQRDDDDSYYLNHDAYGNESEPGAIFSERVNDRNFNALLTILYGHNGFDDTMFETLHNFEDKTFFDEHDKIYVYMADAVYTYTVVSAFTSGDQHLALKYTDMKTIDSDILNPDSSIASNVRSGVELTEEQNVLVLSTCNSGALSNTTRFLVCGVIESVQLTN